jgi:hypothetical protein
LRASSRAKGLAGQQSLTPPVYCRKAEVPACSHCPQWVKSRHFEMSDRCPLYPPKADIAEDDCHVRYVPKADIVRRGKDVAIRSPRWLAREALAEPPCRGPWQS